MTASGTQRRQDPSLDPVVLSEPTPTPQKHIDPVLTADADPGLAEELRRMSIALHDLCQPLTTMQCRLEMAEMIGTDADYREAVSLSITECGRMSQAVFHMREIIRNLMPIRSPEPPGGSASAL